MAHLIAFDFANSEVRGPGIPEEIAADRGSREHGEALGQLDSSPLGGAEELEQGPLLGMVRAGRVARRRADALVLLADDRGIVEVLIWRVTPELAAHPFVQPLGERLGEAIGERLYHD